MSSGRVPRLSPRKELNTSCSNKRYGGARRKYGLNDEEGIDSSWSVARQKKRFSSGWTKNRKIPIEPDAIGPISEDRTAFSPTVLHKSGGGRSGCPSQPPSFSHWHSASRAYRTGVKRGTDAARILQPPAKESASSLEEQASDAGYERAQWIAKLAENSKVIDDLKHQLSEQVKVVKFLKSTEPASARSSASGQQSVQAVSDPGAKRTKSLRPRKQNWTELQKTFLKHSQR